MSIVISWRNSCKNPTDSSLMADYMSYMSKYDDFIKKFDQWGGEDLNDAEFALLYGGSDKSI